MISGCIRSSASFLKHLPTLSHRTISSLGVQRPQFPSRREWRINSVRSHGTEGPNTPGNIEVNYVTKEGKRITLQGHEGDNVMYLAHRNDIEVEGACEASLACCTCHVYVKQEYFDLLDEASEEEEDLLDMAPFLKPNSRLSCQIILREELSGIEVNLPPATRNFYVDGHKASHH